MEINESSRVITIEICGRRRIEELAQKPFDEPTALVSIRDPGRLPPVLKYMPQWCLTLAFEDINLPETQQNTLGESIICVFSAEHAKQIAAFVYGIWGMVSRIICQCEAGVSRSAAVAAAIREHFYKDGAAILNDPVYDPNPLVYHLVLAALDRRRRELS